MSGDFRRSIGLRLAAIQDRLSVGQQISLAAAALSLGLVMVIAAGAAAVSHHQTAELIKGQMSLIAQSMSRQISVGMSDIYHDLEHLVSLDALLPVWSGSPAGIRNVLEQLQSNRPEYVWIGFVAPDGIVRAATGRQLEGRSVAEREWFRKALTAPVINVVDPAKVQSDEPLRLVDIGLPVWTAEGKFIGALTAELSWEWAKAFRNRILHRTAVLGATDIWILDRDGGVLIGEEVGLRPFTQAVIEMMRRTGSGAFVDAADSERELTGYAVMTRLEDELGWIVVARQPEDAAFARAATLIWVIVAIGAIVATIALALAIVIAGRIARPIQNLTSEADRLGRDPAATMFPRQRGSLEVIQLSTALRSLLRRIGFAEQRTQEAELRATENATQYAEDMRALRRLADTDPLTNLMNRRAFLATGRDALEYFRRYDRSMAVLVIDIDYFKKVNDGYGHAAGDATLRRLGEIIEGAIRATDKAARLGGEEFVVLLREVDEIAARNLAERVRHAVEATEITCGGDVIKVTVSIGVAVANAADRDIEDTIERADRGLYMAKNTGRNRVFFMPVAQDVPSRDAA
ncbi:MAG: sensor domain-containing diguanylate cyclase [Xanthobacteraceae bacterium]